MVRENRHRQQEQQLGVEHTLIPRRRLSYGAAWGCLGRGLLVLHRKRKQKKKGVCYITNGNALQCPPLGSPLLKSQSHMTPATRRSGLCSRAVAPSSAHTAEGHGHPLLAPASNQWMSLGVSVPGFGTLAYLKQISAQLSLLWSCRAGAELPSAGDGC